MRLNLSKLDANQNIFLSRQLLAYDEKPYEVLTAGLLGRLYIPLIEGVPEWANSYGYSMYETVGRAKIIGPGANDLPMVDVRRIEVTRNIKQLGEAYQWSVRAIQQAAATGAPLDEMTVMAARTAMASEVDDLLALGNSEYKIYGLLNHPNVNEVVATTKTGGGTSWFGASVTADDILKDINLIVTATRARLKQAGSVVPKFQRFTILLPSAHYSKIATTARSATSDTTILQFAIRNNPWIESIEEWYKCDLADSEGDGPRMVCYPRDPLAVGALIPQEFTSLPPQEDKLNIVVPCTGSCGGVVVRYEVAVSYMDDLGVPA